jgi:hypothetical protein
MKSSRILLLCICGLMSIFAGMSWLNNVYLSWIKRVWINDEADISAIKRFVPLDRLGLYRPFYRLDFYPLFQPRMAFSGLLQTRAMGKSEKKSGSE